MSVNSGEAHAPVNTGEIRKQTVGAVYKNILNDSNQSMANNIASIYKDQPQEKIVALVTPLMTGKDNWKHGHSSVDGYLRQKGLGNKVETIDTADVESKVGYRSADREHFPPDHRSPMQKAKDASMQMDEDVAGIEAARHEQYAPSVTPSQPPRHAR